MEVILLILIDNDKKSQSVLHLHDVQYLTFRKPAAFHENNKQGITMWGQHLGIKLSQAIPLPSSFLLMDCDNSRG